MYYWISKYISHFIPLILAILGGVVCQTYQNYEQNRKTLGINFSTYSSRSRWCETGYSKKVISMASLHKKSWTDSNEQAHRFKGQT
jgi:hypothetical protein